MRCLLRAYLLVLMLWALPAAVQPLFAQTPDSTFVEVAAIMVEDRALADSLYTLIRNGASFFELAARHSTLPNAQEGYQSIWLPADQAPEVASLEVGEATPVQADGEAYWLLRKVYAVDAANYRLVEAADSLNRMVVSLHGVGRYAEAIEVGERALALRQQVLGAEHPSVAQSLSYLAALYRAQGRYAEAEPLFEQALALRRRVLGEDHPDVATSLANLAALYQLQGHYAEAEPLYEQALALFRRVLGEDHPDVATSLNNLAELYRAQGRLEEAEPLHEQTLALSRRVLGQDHPDVATSLNNLAELYRAQGRYAEAEPLFEQALALSLRVLGQDHPDVATSLANLAAVYAAQQHTTEAHQRLLDALHLQTDFLQRTLAFATEREKQQALRAQRNLLYPLLTLTDLASTSAALDALLRRKAFRLDLATEQRRVLTGDDPEVDSLFTELQGLARQIAGLTFSPPRDTVVTAYQRRLATLQRQREATEDRLARRSGTFARAQQTQQATAHRVAEALPLGHTLIEYVRYRPFDHQATGTVSPWQPARYVAFTLTSSNEVRLIDLGAVIPIDSLLAAFRAEIDHFDPNFGRGQQEASHRRLDAISHQLYRLLWEPLGLPETGGVFVSPDGALHRLPFETLVDEAGTYLLDRYVISYLGAGRDVLGFTDASAMEPLYVFADAAFDGPTQTSNSVQAPASVGGRSRDLRGVSFTALPGTAAEAEALQGLFGLPDTQVLRGAEATEAALLALDAPGRLHIATHGFFLDDVEAAMAFDQGFTTLLSDSFRRPEATAALAKWENPLLRSGLALAGANRTLSGDAVSEGGHDGIVTAYELSGMDLRGTDLVVLSACETGVGEIENGEGVLGLRRSLQLAGAQTVVMSLWQVADAATATLMEDFYGRLSAGEGKAVALRAAARSLRSRPGYEHPYYWGAFILAGNPQ